MGETLRDVGSIASLTMIPGLRSSDCKTPAARWVRRVAIAVIAMLVLAWMTQSAFRGMAERAGGNELAMAKAQIKVLCMNLEAYRLTKGRYPTTDEGLTVLVSERVAKYRLGQADRLLKDPWGQMVLYRCPGVHNTKGFELLIKGPDGTADTDDDLFYPGDEAVADQG
jgi:general secretion pathway protein G